MDDDEFDEVATILRGGSVDDAESRRMRDAIEARIGRPVVALTSGTMSLPAPVVGQPGREAPTLTGWVRGPEPDLEHRRQADALMQAVVAEFGPWPGSRFAARSLRSGARSESRSRRIAALAETEVAADQILTGVAYFDEEATSHILDSIPRRRWDQLGASWGPTVVAVAVNADLHRITVLVHTDAQAAEVRMTPRWERWEREIRALIVEGDEFGATAVSPVRIDLYSQESFDREYQGNWSYYWY